EELFSELLCHGIRRDPEGSACRVLLDHKRKLSLDTRSGKRRRTALHTAALKGATGAASLLLEARATVDVLDGDCRTPLMLAAHCGSESCISLLLTRQAQVDRQDAEGRTALHWSSQQLPCLHQLLEARADVSALDLDQRSALFFAQGPGESADCAKALVEAQAEVNAADRCGQTPLFKALQARDDAKVALLLFHGAEVNQKDEFHQTPLFFAAASNQLPQCRQLLDAKAYLSHDVAGRSPVSVAKGQGHMELEKFLCMHGRKSRQQIAAKASAKAPGPAGKRPIRRTGQQTAGQQVKPGCKEVLASTLRGQPEPERKRYDLVFCDEKGIELDMDSTEYQEHLAELLKKVGWADAWSHTNVESTLGG
ncbi:unnamed protein product, partial [Effrenium voratum]